MNRILRCETIEQLEYELMQMNVSNKGISEMCKKSFGMTIKLDHVKIGAANIIKQEMLVCGGDAAISQGVVEGKVKETAVILLGTYRIMNKFIKKMENYTIFGLPKIKHDVENIVENWESEYDYVLKVKNRKLLYGNTTIMGILNVTPDSFSDGGNFVDKNKAIARAIQMEKEGASIIDIGGESTRPGSENVTAEEEAARIIPVIEALKEKLSIPISVDTYKAEVAEKALRAGATLVNDISALRFDKEMVNVLKQHPDIPVVLMHMQGDPRNMQKNPSYKDVIKEVLEFFEERINFCRENGISQRRIIIDPGIGFGKRQEDNLMILQRLGEFHSLGVPVMLGASRKSFIDKIYNSDTMERLEGTLATSALAFRERIHIVRVHDVKEHKRYFQVLNKIRKR